jgi:hypothetical protein
VLRRRQMVTVLMRDLSQGLRGTPKGLAPAANAREKWQREAAVPPLPHKTTRPGSTAGFGIRALRMIHSLFCEPDTYPRGPWKTRRNCSHSGWRSKRAPSQERARWSLLFLDSSASLSLFFLYSFSSLGGLFAVQGRAISPVILRAASPSDRQPTPGHHSIPSRVPSRSGGFATAPLHLMPITCKYIR